VPRLWDTIPVSPHDEVVRRLRVIRNERMQLITQRLHVRADMTEHTLAEILRGQQTLHILHHERRRPDHLDKPQIALVQRLFHIMLKSILVMRTTSSPNKRIRLARRTANQDNRTLISLQPFHRHIHERIVTINKRSLHRFSIGGIPLIRILILKKPQIHLGRSLKKLEIPFRQSAIRIHNLPRECTQPQSLMRGALHLNRHHDLENRMIVLVSH
jgi:hypothetical protein